VNTNEISDSVLPNVTTSIVQIVYTEIKEGQAALTFRVEGTKSNLKLK
jgi:hypothetical protein